VARHRREVAGEDQHPLRVAGGAGEGDDVVGRVVGLEPVEARRVEVLLPQRGLVLVGAVEVAHERLDARVVGALEQVPVE
jgi:hypothetical protein